MNSAFNDKQTSKEGGALARHALRAALACALVLGGGAAFAQQHGDRDYAAPQPPERHAERFRLPPQMDHDPRQAEAQMRAYQEQRGQQPYPQQQQPYAQPQYPQQYQEQQRPRSGRMTADERAEMRRQINEAKDFYPQRH